MWPSWKIYFFLKFVQNISPFLIAWKPPANNLHNQLQLTKFGRCEPSNIPSIRLCIWLEIRLPGQHTIHTIHQQRFQARPPSCLLKRELEKIAFKAIRKRNGWPNFWLKLNGRNARMRKTYCSIEEYLPLKKICLILKPCREIAQSFEESLQWGKLVKI